MPGCFEAHLLLQAASWQGEEGNIKGERNTNTAYMVTSCKTITRKKAEFIRMPRVNARATSTQAQGNSATSSTTNNSYGALQLQC